jgi:hypothetical protein
VGWRSSFGWPGKAASSLFPQGRECACSWPWRSSRVEDLRSLAAPETETGIGGRPSFFFLQLVRPSFFLLPRARGRRRGWDGARATAG